MNAALLVLLLSATDLTAEVKARLAEQDVITGTFEQSKVVKGFKKPFKSTGAYEVKKGEGVKWNTAAPFASELTVSADSIRSMQGGAEQFKLDAKTEPTVRVITQLLFSLLSGDLNALSTHFDVKGQVDGKEWSIELTPKPGPLAKVFNRISLKGDAAVRSVHMQELSGDATLISLTPAPVGKGP